MRYRKRPVEVDAVQYDENDPQPTLEFLIYWDAMYSHTRRTRPEQISSTGGVPSVTYYRPSLTIKTLEGWLEVSHGDWVIAGVHGECYPCKPDIFEQTYEGPL